MRKMFGLIIGLGCLAALMLVSLAQAAPGGVGLTPTVWVYFPFVALYPTPTITNTPTPTVTPTPSATPSATATVPPAQNMAGGLRREEPTKPSYATNIEDIWHWFYIHNPNASTVYYGILGVNVVKDAGGYSFFHTSWSGQLAPNGVLSINGGCFGPGGCWGTSGQAELRDTVKVAQPGDYTMTLAICQSSFDGCLQPSGSWQNLASVTFTAIDWTPTPPPPMPDVVSTPMPSLTEPCQLITDDPAGTYLRCANLP